MYIVRVYIHIYIFIYLQADAWWRNKNGKKKHFTTLIYIYVCSFTPPKTIVMPRARDNGAALLRVLHYGYKAIFFKIVPITWRHWTRLQSEARKTSNVLGINCIWNIGTLRVIHIYTYLVIPCSVYKLNYSQRSQRRARGSVQGFQTETGGLCLVKNVLIK